MSGKSETYGLLTWIPEDEFSVYKYDWGYLPFADVFRVAVGEDVSPVRFHSGDVVKVFQTVTDGDVLWTGVIALDHGVQRSFSEEDWTALFESERPARVERDGKVFFGHLNAYLASETEGIRHAALYPYTPAPGAPPVHFLEDGDRLTVYGAVRSGAVVWQGALSFGSRGCFGCDGRDVVREALHMETSTWQKLTFQRRPVAVSPV